MTYLIKTAAVILMITAGSSMLTATEAWTQHSQQRLQLTTPDNMEGDRVRCRVGAVIATTSGTAFECQGQNGKAGLLIMRGDQGAGMTLALAMMENSSKSYRYFVVHKPRGTTRKICTEAQEVTGTMPCYAVSAARMSAQDSLVKVGNAKPGNLPNVPTGDAQPPRPVPTDDVRPD